MVLNVFTSRDWMGNPHPVPRLVGDKVNYVRNIGARTHQNGQ
jgi:hypothetical protein